MNFLCPSCRTPLPRGPASEVVPCTQCGVEVDLTRMETAPGTARLWPDVDLEGETLGRYRLTKRLAAGGMGIVYEAEGPGGPCAVKVLAALLAAEPELRKRFQREAAALRAIEHPGVVRVLDEGEERGFCWYAMERVAGKDLRARIEAGPLPADEVERLARSLLATLEVVHARGFVHRDIKPGNILLAPEGPKLCDFGIARFDGSTTLTESAAVLGSLRYMAPEQRLGRTTTLSDLYSLGVVLFEALAQGVPGEKDLPAGVPRRLRGLVTRLLADKPAERPADAAAALRLLEAPSRARRWTAAAAPVVIALLATGGYLAQRASRLEPMGDPGKGAVKDGPVVQAKSSDAPLKTTGNVEQTQANATEGTQAQTATTLPEPQQAKPAVDTRADPAQAVVPKNASKEPGSKSLLDGLGGLGTKGIGTRGTRAPSQNTEGKAPRTTKPAPSDLGEASASSASKPADTDEDAAAAKAKLLKSKRRGKVAAPEMNLSDALDGELEGGKSFEFEKTAPVRKSQPAK